MIAPNTLICFVFLFAANRSALKRDIYFMNLNNIDSDSELLSAFASIPRKSMVVFEDVDAMTPVSFPQPR